MSFADAVRDLGGDEEDISLLENVRSDISDVEGEDVLDADLPDDVDRFWNQIASSTTSNAKSNVKTNGLNKKTKFDVDGAPQLIDTTATSKQPNLGSAKAGKKAKEQGPGPSEVSTSSKTTKNTRGKILNEPAVPDPNHESKRSRKARARAEEWMGSLTHPNEMMLGELDAWWNYRWDAPKNAIPVPSSVLPELKAKARQLLDAENTVWHKDRLHQREYVASLEFLKSGTLSDQLGTLSILSTESPLHSMRHIQNLLGKCQIKNRESATRALEVAKDLLVSHILPDRRLKWFKDEPLVVGAPPESLILWAFEDWLKQEYFGLLQTMERLLGDSVENIRLRTLHCVFDLLRLKPEQEANLLRLGLNKMGDPEGKVASRVKKLLMDVLQEHPAMKSVVATSISELLSRSSDYRTRYYSVDTLSEFILSSSNPELANSLVHIYLELFERLLAQWDTQGVGSEVREDDPSELSKSNKQSRKPQRGKKGGIRQRERSVVQSEEEQRSRLVAKIFTGLNRAFPFSELSSESFSKYTDTIYRMSHSSNVGTFIEALAFIFQLTQTSTSGEPDARFYRALYESLQDPRIHNSSKLGKYLHMLLRALSVLKAPQDTDIARATAFAKRAVQSACQWSEIGAAASLVHAANNTPHIRRLLATAQAEIADEYDPKKRDPVFAKAETSRLWEVVPLLSHYHPTVSLYASNLVADEPKELLDLPDIEQYTVNSFLAKWSYKKVRAKENSRGGSIFQPLSGYTDLNLGIRQQAPASSVPVSVQNWANRKIEDVAPDEKFFYEYFHDQYKPAKPSRTVSSGESNGLEADAEESGDEDEIYQAMLKTGELGSDFSDDDLEMLDYSESDDGEEETATNGATSGTSEAVGLSDSEIEGFEEFEDFSPGHEAGLEATDESDAEGIDDPEGEIDSDLDDDSDVYAEVSARQNSQESHPNKSSTEAKTEKSKKRNREWAEMPMFMDADEFEAQLSKRKRN